AHHRRRDQIHDGATEAPRAKERLAMRVQADPRSRAGRGDHAAAQPRAVHRCEARSRRHAGARQIAGNEMTERPPDPSRTPSDVRRTFFDRRLLTKRAATAAFVAVLMISLVAPTAAQTDHIALRRQAAEQGDVKSQLALGLMYANGSNVPQDYAEAAKWL